MKRKSTLADLRTQLIYAECHASNDTSFIDRMQYRDHAKKLKARIARLERKAAAKAAK